MREDGNRLWHLRYSTASEPFSSSQCLKWVETAPKFTTLSTNQWSIIANTHSSLSHISVVLLVQEDLKPCLPPSFAPEIPFLPTSLSYLCIINQNMKFPASAMPVCASELPPRPQDCVQMGNHGQLAGGNHNFYLVPLSFSCLLTSAQPSVHQSWEHPSRNRMSPTESDTLLQFMKWAGKIF